MLTVQAVCLHEVVQEAVAHDSVQEVIAGQQGMKRLQLSTLNLSKDRVTIISKY